VDASTLGAVDEGGGDSVSDVTTAARKLRVGIVVDGFLGRVSRTDL